MAFKIHNSKKLAFAPVSTYQKMWMGTTGFFFPTYHQWIMLGSVCVYIIMIAFTLLPLSIQRFKFASLFKPQQALFHFDIINVQHQANFSDCGLCIIAFTTELAHSQHVPHAKSFAHLLRSWGFEEISQEAVCPYGSKI